MILSALAGGVSGEATAAEVAPNADVSLERSVKLQALEKGKWLPVPIPVSNPTFGFGLQAVLLYLHPKKTGDDTDTPAATSGIGGMYTDTDSKVLGVFHDNDFANDKNRLKLLAGAADLNLDIYGIGQAAPGGGVGYNIRAGIGLVQFLVRLPYLEHNYIGVRHLYAGANVAFDLAFLLPPGHDVE